MQACSATADSRFLSRNSRAEGKQPLPCGHGSVFPSRARQQAVFSMGFIIGDGRLNYAPESITEAYYAWHALRDWTFTLDYQRVVNPAYNRDRGPVTVGSLRVHWER